VKRVLVLFAHPCPESFSAALHGQVVARLSAGGWEVDDCDLNAENFYPVLTEAERRGYHEEPANIEPVAAYVERVRAADALVMVFPVWNFGYPAILKGFLDRLILPGDPSGLRMARSGRTHEDRKLAAVTT
jgi:Putative NADPH-quinone reductase (modulator of drug activity B)